MHRSISSSVRGRTMANQIPTFQSGKTAKPSSFSQTSSNPNPHPVTSSAPKSQEFAPGAAPLAYPTPTIPPDRLVQPDATKMQPTQPVPRSQSSSVGLPPMTPSATQAAPRMEKTPVDANGDALDSLYERVDLPSNFVFYDFDALNVRKFDAFDQAKLARAIRSRNISLLLDVLSACCDQDVRQFVSGDFQALCYWHRLNSYLSAPNNVSWFSRYGSQANVQAHTKLDVTYCAKTRADYADIVSRGYCVSRMRELELLTTANLDPDRTYLFEKAQYINPAPLQAEIDELTQQGDSLAEITARINQLNRLVKRQSGAGLGVFNEIQQITVDYDCGMAESAKVRAPNVDWNSWLIILDARSDESTMAGLEAIQEAVEIRATLSKKEFPVAKEEEVPLGFNLWTHFPWV